MKRILVSIDEKGIGWAAESEKKEPHPNDFAIGEMWDESCEHQYYAALGDFERHIATLPRLECHPDLIVGLKVGDQLPEAREHYEMEYSSHPDEPPYWIEMTKSDYDTNKEMLDCRIILVPVEAKQEQGCKHDGLVDTYVGYYHCQHCDKAWTYAEWNNSLKPQSQGEDELWTEVEMDLRKSLGIDNYRSAKFVYYIKQRFTLTRKG